MCNAAYSLGIGSCCKQMFESEEGKALLKEWGIEGEYIGDAFFIMVMFGI